MSAGRRSALRRTYLGLGLGIGELAAARCFHDFCAVLREELQVEPDAALTSRLAESGIHPA